MVFSRTEKEGVLSVDMLATDSCRVLIHYGDGDSKGTVAMIIPFESAKDAGSRVELFEALRQRVLRLLMVVLVRLKRSIRGDVQIQVIRASYLIFYYLLP